MTINAVNRVSSGDSQTYEAVDANLSAGVLVIPSTTATVSGLQGIKVATDAAKNVLGVAMKNTITEANQAAAQSGSESDGYPFVYPDGPLATTAVESHGVFQLTYTASAVAYGAKLCAAASGSVRAWVCGTDGADAIIGFCANPGGVSGSGGLGLVRVNL